MEQTHDAVQEENRRIRLLRMVSDLLVQVLMSGRVSLSEADSLIKGTRKFAMKLFPGKEPQFDLIYLPRFRRAIHESGMCDNGPELRILQGGKSLCNNP